MATQKFTGVIPPVVVPDTEDHQLDVASFERSINRMIDAGVDGLFFLGSSGEVVFSTDERRRQIIAEAVRIVDHRVPVLVGIIDTETERMIEHGKVAQELGADALVATCPFYALQGMTEVEEHFRILHEELDLPIFAYDIPVCVHTKLPWKLLAKLGAEGVLAGVKDSSGDDISFRYLIQENEKNGHPMSILTGHEVVVDGAYLGGAAAIRCQGLADIAAIKGRCEVPVIGLWKDGHEGVYITPTLRHARACVAAGADIVAIDATDRPRPDGKTVEDTFRPLHEEGVLLMADCATIEDIRRAVDLGFDLVSTTLSHGVAAIDCTMADGPDLPLLRQATEEFPGLPIICEGRVHTPEEARAAIDAGAWAVVVGTAITHPTSITSWFKAALEA